MFWSIKEKPYWEWHSVFAWLPHQLIDKSWAWFETIERRRWASASNHGWEYRQLHGCPASGSANGL